ncbi:hypothetical protein KJ903_05765 [Patescibacteria group bacterium]|nr:hypothetical protein [Patescibacteria group bacterium]
MGLEKDFKKQLQSAADSPKDFNEYFTVLTAPSEPSFLAREEAELIKIAKRSSSEQAKKLAEHAAKYFWLSNSYAKVRELSAKYFTRRLRSITNKKQISEVATKKKKAVLIDQLQLDSAAVANIELIDFTTSWQDERKANILQAIGYLKRIVDEISRRTKIAKKYLYYLGVRDIINLNSFSDLKAWQTELRKRSPGVFFLMQTEKEHVLTGQEYLKISKYRTELEKEMSVIERELHGSVAMTGTAIGRAVICRGLSSLAKVRPGDIIVASMTRPEFMPALRKAAGIVTDEGGITCHAAIVARELNIPTVIGTKKATKIFRDGMKIEVRANHGIVRELK